MKKMRILLVVAALGVVAHAGPMVYSVDTSSDDLSTFDLATGIGTSIGALDPSREGTGQFQDNRYATPISLAVNPLNGEIWVRNNTKSVNPAGLTSTGDLITVNATTGAATLVLTGSSVIRLAFAPDGTLYGLSGNQVGTVDLGTGAFTSLGFSSVFGYGLAVDPTGTLLYGVSGGGLLSVTDLGTHVTTTIGTLSPSVGILGAIEFDPVTGILWGSAFGGSSSFFQIDTTNAAVSNVVTVSGPIFSSQGFGFVEGSAPPIPEPGSLVLTAAAALAFAAIRHRRRARNKA